MITFVINLDRSTDRWEQVLNECRLAGIVPTRIAAVEGRNVPEWMASQFPPSQMTDSEVGCYASHMVAARMIVDRKLDWAVVLEDDAVLAPGFAGLVRSAVAKARGFDVIHLSTRFKRAALSVADLGGGSHLVRHSRLPTASACYVMSAVGAKKWLKPQPRLAPNDMSFRYAWKHDFNFFGVFPAPASQRVGIASTLIHFESGIDRRNWSDGVLSELRGVLWQLRRVGVVSSIRLLLRNATLRTLHRRSKKIDDLRLLVC